MKDTIDTLKTFGTTFLILGSILNSFNIYPWGVVLLTIGSLFWLIVGIEWKDKQMITLNSFFLITGIVGVLWNLLN